MSPQTAVIPDYLIPPPSIFLIFLANHTSFSVPSITLPNGHPIPLDKQKLTVLNSSAYTSGAIFYSIRAFKSLAPSKCILNLAFFAICLTSWTCSNEIKDPITPPCEFSIDITVGCAICSVGGGMDFLSTSMLKVPSPLLGTIYGRILPIAASPPRS